MNLDDNNSVNPNDNSENLEDNSMNLWNIKYIFDN